jgi:UDP-galactopyranose mutase
MKKALIIGGGVSGCTVSYGLKKAGWDVTILEKNDGVGGMSRTYFYHGHPYEFGPHVWFWPKQRENQVILELAEGGMWEIDRQLYTFTEHGLFRYPIHANDINQMPDADQIWLELSQHRDQNNKLNYNALPRIGVCKFNEYFEAAIGPTLYNRFMKEYTHKMWGIHGHELETCMVWADRMKDINNVIQYDPIKWEEQHSLGKGLGNWYPKHPSGWNIVWENMVKGCTIIYNVDVELIESQKTVVAKSAGTLTYSCSITDFDAIICTISPDALLNEWTLPGQGRMIIPLLIPDNQRAYPEGVESIHYADDSPITRTTEMKNITKHESKDTLLLIEMPIDGTHNQAIIPSNIAKPQHYQRRCYARQTKEAIAQHYNYIQRLKSLDPRIFVAGRHGKFQYWGMPQTVEDGLNVVEEILLQC